MSASPLTLDTLKSPSNESSLSLPSPLMSPQSLKAESVSSSNDMDTILERPSNLTLDSTYQQPQQSHSNITPSSSTTTLHGNISPALSSAGSLSPSFLPEMPQWKRDLILRRKQNVQRTISASSPTSSSSVLSSSPTTAFISGGLKTSTSSSSVRSLVGSNTNIDQLASDGLQQVCSTKDYTKTSLLPFGNTTATTAKVNKQYITTASTNTTKPATNIKSSATITSPLKEKAEKLFGGQYTATKLSSSSATTKKVTTLTTKEEIIKHQQQEQQHQHEVLANIECKEEIPQQQETNKMMEENEEEHFEMYRKTKEVLNDETTQATTTTSIVTNKQQMATRLTGSTYSITTNTSNSSSATSSSPSSSSSILKRAETEREKLLNTTTQQHHNITGANVNLANQSLNKCESERLVCAANNKNKFNTGNSNNCNTNNSVTIGGISVSGNISNNQNSNCSSVTTNVGKISQKLQENQFIKNEQQLNIKKNIKYKPNTVSGGNISLDLKSPTKISSILTTSNSTSCLTSSSSSSLHSTAAVTSSTNCAIKKKMVAVQEMKKSTQNSATHLHPINSTCHATNRANNRVSGVDGGRDTDLDNSEDLSYGPGIVSKLRCRYLSLALRESMEQQRLNKDQLRRSTSLNNLLDNTEDEENCDEDDEEETEEIVDEDVENQGFNYKVIGKNPTTVASTNAEYKKAGILKTSINNGQEKRFVHNSQGSNGVGVTFTETSYTKRSRHLKRGNDSLKRARSVEALLSEKSPWHTRANSSTPTCVTIEDKIHNARERLHLGTDHMPPKRLTSIIDDTERPPPDLVKQTLKMFEATANRRPRATNRSNSKGDVASKVETFKNIIKEQKPVVTFPKPLSPTKKMNTPTLQKSLKTSTPQANDLLQSPLGRKAKATATSVNNTSDCLTPLKTNNTLSDHTPDIIPRQKFNTDRDFKQNKEIFSAKEKFLSNESEMESSLSSKKRENLKEKFEVDSPITALSKELSKIKLNDTPVRKHDNTNSAVGSSSSSSDNYEPVNNVGIVGGVGGGDNNGGDACQRHNKYPYNNSNTNDLINEEITQQELNISSLQNENDKFKNKTIPISTNEATNSSQSSSTTIETKNEATVNNYDSSTKVPSPPPSSSDLSDVDIGENYDDDDYGGLKTTKRITRTALDNIAKAGYTQQFKFNTANNTNSSSTSTTSVNNSTTSPLNTGKQIGVIRPLLNTNQQQQKTTDSNMETLKHSNTTSLTSREIEKNRINDLKKSSAASSANVAANSSPSTSLDHQVIKPSYTSSPPATSNNAASANNSATGFSDVDTVISATNSPLWAMRKRRQTPPAQPAENTSMVFNFSNRKEVPDYIENDGVVFRRKRELPKPNESGFVLLGDLSVETSTDMDYDDFAMCPPSPCDVEFVNANIVIDGKSSIRQKSKDTAFHVQFNDTLTSTFEYPSEASLIVDESFTAYNESYAQPLGSSSSSDDFVQAFQNLNLENATSHHHVADEIIQLPTFNASSPAASNTSSPTKNILGNLPLDYPDLQKGTQLTTSTATAAAPTATSKEDNELQQQQLGALEKKKSRKDLKLPLGQQQGLQKPPLPMKRFQMTKPPAAAGVSVKLLNSKNLPRNLKPCEVTKQPIKVTVIPNEEQQQQQHKRQQQQQQHYKEDIENGNASVTKADLPPPRKTPRVLNNPQYACFLQETKPHVTKPVQRSRSNEFQKTFGTLSVSATVSRSNSLRNLEYVPANRVPNHISQSTAIGATSSLCFSPEVNLTQQSKNLSHNEMAKNPNAFKNPPPTPQAVNNAKIESPRKYKNALDPNTSFEIGKNSKCLSLEFTERTQSLINLEANNLSSLNFKDNLFRSVDNFKSKELTNFKNSNELAEQCVKSLENLKFESLENTNKITETKENVFKTRENTNKITKSSVTKNFTQNSQSVETSLENREHMASFDCKISSDVKVNPAAVFKDATTTNSTNLDDFSKDYEDLLKLTQKTYDLNENSGERNSHKKCKNSLDTNGTIFLENCNENTENLSKKFPETKRAEFISNSAPDNIEKIIYPPTKCNAAISLTVNSKYVTDYRSKITKNLPHKGIKLLENASSQSNFNLMESRKLLGDSLSLKINEKENSSLSFIDKSNRQSKSYEHLEESAFKLPLKGSSISSDSFADIKEYSLFRKIEKEEAPARHKAEAVAVNSNLMLTQNIENLSESIDDDLRDLTENPSKPVDDLDYTFNSAVSKDTRVDSPAVTANLQDDNEYLLTSTAKFSLNPNSSEFNLAPNLTTKSTDDLTANSENSISTNNTILNKSLQISRDSLDSFEDAKENKKDNLLTDLEASEILEDIAVGPSFPFDFPPRLLTLKKSKTSYCLQNLEKSNSLESADNNNSSQSDDSNFVSASNTLESKCSLKPRETTNPAIESIRIKQPEMRTKSKSKTLRVKTTEKILNLSNMASQNVSSYATFRKSKSFYKNASKSFKNSLRFYETFSEKTSQTMTAQSPIKRSNSVVENSIKKAELNRKIFSKSCKTIAKLPNTEVWDSPTENSYSFEYFDAEGGDLNGNLYNLGCREGNNNVILKPLIEINENFDQKASLADDDLNKNEILKTEKSINLKPVSKDFYFNTSPRPFKRIYEATTIVGIERSSHKPTDLGSTVEKLPQEAEKDGESLKDKPDNPKCFLMPNGVETTKSFPAAKDNLNYSIDFTNCSNKLSAQQPTVSSSTPMITNYSTISTLSTPSVLDYSSSQRANSFSTFKSKHLSNNSFKKSRSFNNYSKNVSRKLETFNKNAKPVSYSPAYDNANKNSKKSYETKDFNKNVKNEENFGNKLIHNETHTCPNVIRAFEGNEALKLLTNSPIAKKSNPKVETFKRNINSTEFSFNLTKFSSNSPKFVDNSPVDSSPQKETLNESSLNDNFSSNEFDNLSNDKNFPESNFPLAENSNVKSSSCNKTFTSEALNLNKFDKYDSNCNVTPTTTCTPTTTTTTLTAKDLNKTTTKFCTTTTTSTTTPTTNFPTKVAAINNPKSSNISYTNSSCSSFSPLRYTNKSFTTAKYHQKKATTIATTTTTTMTFTTPAAPLKNTARINPPKVLPRRLLVNAPKATTTMTSTKTTATTSCNSNTSSTTSSSTCFKPSSYTTTTTCSSANKKVPPLRRRIPGNTLYYV